MALNSMLRSRNFLIILNKLKELHIKTGQLIIKPLKTFKLAVYKVASELYITRDKL